MVCDSLFRSGYPTGTLVGRFLLMSLEMKWKETDCPVMPHWNASFVNVPSTHLCYGVFSIHQSWPLIYVPWPSVKLKQCWMAVSLNTTDTAREISSSLEKYHYFLANFNFSSRGTQTLKWISMCQLLQNNCEKLSIVNVREYFQDLFMGVLPDKIRDFQAFLSVDRTV